MGSSESLKYKSIVTAFIKTAIAVVSFLGIFSLTFKISILQWLTKKPWVFK